MKVFTDSGLEVKFEDIEQLDGLYQDGTMQQIFICWDNLEQLIEECFEEQGYVETAQQLELSLPDGPAVTRTPGTVVQTTAPAPAKDEHTFEFKFL